MFLAPHDLICLMLILFINSLTLRHRHLVFSHFRNISIRLTNILLTSSPPPPHCTSRRDSRFPPPPPVPPISCPSPSLCRYLAQSLPNNDLEEQPVYVCLCVCGRAISVCGWGLVSVANKFSLPASEQWTLWLGNLRPATCQRATLAHSRGCGGHFSTLSRRPADEVTRCGGNRRDWSEENEETCVCLCFWRARSWQHHDFKISRN